MACSVIASGRRLGLSLNAGQLSKLKSISCCRKSKQVEHWDVEKNLDGTIKIALRSRISNLDKTFC